MEKKKKSGEFYVCWVERPTLIFALEILEFDFNITQKWPGMNKNLCEKLYKASLVKRFEASRNCNRDLCRILYILTSRLGFTEHGNNVPH